VGSGQFGSQPDTAGGLTGASVEGDLEIVQGPQSQRPEGDGWQWEPLDSPGTTPPTGGITSPAGGTGPILDIPEKPGTGTGITGPGEPPEILDIPEKPGTGTGIVPETGRWTRSRSQYNFRGATYWQKYQEPDKAVGEYRRLVPQFKNFNDALAVWNHLVRAGFTSTPAPPSNMMSGTLREGRQRRRTLLG
jgi:hypothetical protein